MLENKLSLVRFYVINEIRRAMRRCRPKVARSNSLLHSQRAMPRRLTRSLASSRWSRVSSSRLAEAPLQEMKLRGNYFFCALRLRGCGIAPFLVPWSLASHGAFPALLVSWYSLRSMTSHPASHFAGYHGGSQGFMKQLRLAGGFMAKSLTSLGGYYDGPQGLMKQLRLAGGFRYVF